MNTQEQVVKVSKADPIADQVVQSRLIAITEPMPAFPRDTYVQEDERYFLKQAVAIADALDASLPGGTLDRLFAVMAMRKASALHVPAFQPHSPQQAPVTGIRLFCWEHQAVHTFELGDVERLVYALSGVADMEDATDPAASACMLEVLDAALTGSWMQYVDLMIGRREDGTEWVNPDA